MKHLYENKQFAHYPVKSLCFYSKRENLLHCSLGTWYKYSKLYKFERPRNKIQFPKKDLIGIQALSPNELLHIDITILKILNGTIFYLQALIDNHSNYIVGWSIEKNKKAINTSKLIQNSISNYKISNPYIMMDRGTENLNNCVDQLVKIKSFTRIVARRDVRFSNSKIETFFRSLKSNHLKHKYMWSKKDLINEVKFYINEYNDHVPHSALNGLTPSEVYNKKSILKITHSWPKRKMEAIENRRVEYWSY